MEGRKKKMIVCPACSYPVEEKDVSAIVDKDMRCYMCDWKGKSSDSKVHRIISFFTKSFGKCGQEAY
jgi:hypothetical protein